MKCIERGHPLSLISQDSGAATVAVTNMAGSPLAATADLALVTQAGRELGAREAMAKHLCPMDIGPALDQSCREAMETGAREEREACEKLARDAIDVPETAEGKGTALYIAELIALRGRGEPAPRDGEEGE